MRAGLALAMDGSLQPVRVLSVDDEPDVEALLSQSFRRQIRDGAFEFSFTCDGAAALRLLEQQRFDVILLDINMPVMDGLTLLGRLSDTPQDARVVMVSAYGDMSNIRTSMNRGAYDFVTKPVDMKDLDATIRKTAAEVFRYRDMQEARRASDRARANLSRYFPPKLAEYLANQDQPLGQVRRQEVAVLFADLVGFTVLAEEIPPEDVIDLLRDFHGRMSKIVFAHDGTIEKYIGDAICCSFGVFEAEEADAARAVRCAFAMADAIAEWNEERAASGQPPLQIGVGVNYGPAVIGDVGTEHSMSFATIGATVNLASRLQSATRDLGAAIVISGRAHEVMQRTADPALSARFSESWDIPVRGVSRPVRVHSTRATYPLSTK